MLVWCMNLKIGKVFTSKFVGTGPSSYGKRIYRAAFSQTLRNTAVENPPSTDLKRRGKASTAWNSGELDQKYQNMYSESYSCNFVYFNLHDTAYRAGIRKFLNEMKQNFPEFNLPLIYSWMQINVLQSVPNIWTWLHFRLAAAVLLLWCC